MRDRPCFPLSVFLLSSAVLVGALPAQESPDRPNQAVVDFLRAQGLENSQVMDHLSWICDVHGPRLTGSKNLRRAQDWAVERLKGWGYDDAHLEEWGPFGKGWELRHFSMHATGANPWTVLAYPKAWSPSLDGRLEAEVVYVAEMDADTLEATDLAGKIVLVEGPRDVSEPFEGLAKRHDPQDLLTLATGAVPPTPGGTRSGDSMRRGFQRRGQILQMVWDKKPAMILDRGFKGDYGTVFVSGASVPSPSDVPRGQRPRAWTAAAEDVIPQATLAVEHYNRMVRLIKKGLPVRLAVELDVRFDDSDPMERNVIASISGTDPARRDEVVMLGAHFDSWHTGTGSTDNGAGSAVMMEAARLLSLWIKDQGEGPRRTIRIALWAGEEQGLLGSRAYASRHFGSAAEPTALHGKVSGYFNLDNGTGRIRGVYQQGNAGVGPIFREWLKPFHDLEATTMTLDNTGGTDHLAFDRVGIPGFQFIQDPVAYSPRTHHSNMDNWDHAVAEDLQQAATIVASFVWHTAQRDEMLPRKQLSGQ